MGTKVWLMKVFKEWYDLFEHGIVGIDEDGIDDWYTNLTEKQKEKVFSSFGRPGTRKKFFEQFAYGMSKGDIIFIGTGQASKFNINAIAKVTGEYRFDASETPRHLRNVEIIVLEQPIPYDKWSWAKRVEKLPESKMDEFAEIVSKLIF